MEISWLRQLTCIRTSFCRNLHAKCYINEELCIITSLNLYEFSQVNNNEMGILIRRSEDAELYREAYEEAQRIIRISDEVRISLERVTSEEKAEPATEAESGTEEADAEGKLTTSKLARKLGLKTAYLTEKLLATGHLELKSGKPHLTDKGKEAGGEFSMSQRFGAYFLWPESMSV